MHRVEVALVGTLENPDGVVHQVKHHGQQLQALNAKLNNGMTTDLAELKRWKMQLEQKADIRRKHWSNYEAAIASTVVTIAFSVLAFFGKMYIDGKSKADSQERSKIIQELAEIQARVGK